MNVCNTEKDSSVVHVAYRLASLANDPPCSSSGHLDVSLQFDLLLRPEEVLLLQFAIDSALSLQDGDKKLIIHFSIVSWQFVMPIRHQ